MTLSIEEKKAIIEYRIQKAWNSIREAEDNANLVIGHWPLPDCIMQLIIWLRLYLLIKGSWRVHILV